MEAFDWSTQPPAAPSDDADLLAAFLGTSFDDQLHSDGCCGGGGDGNVSSEAYGRLDLPPPSAASRHDMGLLRCHDGVTVPGGASSSTGFHHHMNPAVGFLPVPAIAGTHDGRLGALDGFGFPADVPEEPTRAAGSNAAFSGYSTTTGGGGGGNISSGESNTYGGGGHDTEVASSSSRPVVVMPPSKRKLVLGKYPAATTADQEAEERWGTTRAAATTTTNITFGQSGGGARGYELDTEAIAQVKETIYRAAAMRPMNLGGPSSGAGPSSAAPDQKPRRRKNVRISSDPQTVAARLRREKVSERLRALQRLVPGGSKMDTASMLDEAASYLKFLKSQLAALETLDAGGGGGRSVQRYVDMVGGGRSPNHSQLSFGRDGITGYVKSRRNMQLS